MTRKNGLLAAASALLLIGFTSSAAAIDLSVGGLDVSVGGGGDGGGVSASVGSGDSSVGVDIGGNDDSLASVDVSAGAGVDQSFGVDVSNQDGQIVTLDNGQNSTNAGINLGLGGILNGLGGGLPVIGDPGTGGLLPGGGGTGGGGVSPTAVAAAFGGLSGAQQQLLVNRCGSVLASPRAYDRDLVSLCQILAQIRR